MLIIIITITILTIVMIMIMHGFGLGELEREGVFYAEINCRCLPMGNMWGSGVYIVIFIW